MLVPPELRGIKGHIIGKTWRYRKIPLYKRWLIFVRGRYPKLFIPHMQMLMELNEMNYWQAFKETVRTFWRASEFTTK
jgi:hypothetical protein